MRGIIITSSYDDWLRLREDFTIKTGLKAHFLVYESPLSYIPEDNQFMILLSNQKMHVAELQALDDQFDVKFFLYNRITDRIAEFKENEGGSHLLSTVFVANRDTDTRMIFDGLDAVINAINLNFNSLGSMSPTVQNHVVDRKQLIQYSKRVQDAADALSSLRSNEAAAHIEELQNIAVELQKLEASSVEVDVDASKLQKLTGQLVSILSEIAKVIKNDPVARITFAGALAVCLPVAGMSAVAAIAVINASLMGKDAFEKAIKTLPKPKE